MFGVSTGSMFWPGFGAYAVDCQRPFISETGYRSFIGCHAEVVPGITPDVFAAEIGQGRRTLAGNARGSCGRSSAATSSGRWRGGRKGLNRKSRSRLYDRRSLAVPAIHGANPHEVVIEKHHPD